MLGSYLVSAIAALLLLLTFGFSEYLVSRAPPSVDRLPCLALKVARGVSASLIRRAGVVWLGTALMAAPSLGRAFDTAPTTTPINKTIELLVTTAPGAPTPQQIVDYYVRPIGPPPLQSLTVENPVRVDFLLQERAEGDALAWLDANPRSARAKLERYLLVIYPNEANVERALSALHADPYVASAQEPIPMEFSSVDLIDFNVGGGQASDTQYGRDALNVDAGWQITGGGYALVADIDSGLFTDHPSLRQFVGNQYVGGNFVSIASLDISGYGLKPAPIPNDANVDEREAVLISDPNCSPGGPSMMSAVLAGHGTHTAGLIAAIGDAGMGVEGTCKHCGIGMWKVAYTSCRNGEVVPVYNPNANAAALAAVGDSGAQIASMSFGGDRPANYCVNLPSDEADAAMCLALDHAYHRDIAMVAASGNSRSDLEFPANDSRVVGAGGFQTDLTLWDDSPGNLLHCPLATDAECGSNWTTPINSPKQELVASAKSVLSTTYPGFDWNPLLKCGDNFGPGGGVGLCTGTSMSAPQIAGVAALVRSVNPLVPVGKPTFNPLFEKASLRSVIASTTAEAQANLAWTAQVGYGRPDAAAAARKMLGKVAGVYIRNRVTPLFRLYSSATKDYADTTSPQVAIALIVNQKNAWTPSVNVPLVPNYPSFPYDTNDPNDPNDYYDTTPPAPRAAVYVMTTAIKPRAEWPDLVPLHLMDKSFPSGRDFMLVTTTADIQQAHADGYGLRTIQGYIYKPCTPMPACIPPAAQKFWRKCRIADNDCTTFLESERNAFEVAGYTAAYPAGSNAMLGYAYPATDTDGDGLPDGFEYVVGTSPALANSDNDPSPDAVEFPMVGVPVSDPCGGSGSSGAQFCLANSIFKNGFDPL